VKEIVKELGMFIVGVFLFGLLMFGLQELGVMNYRFFGPQIENAHRAVFEETKSYRDGSRRDFMNLYLSYQSAGMDAKPAIKSVMCDRANGLAPDVIPVEVKSICNIGE
jgi:hypothetical protein